MKSFLRETAAEILREHRAELHKILLIFPNKRSKLFFNKHFAEEYGKAHRSLNSHTLKSLIYRYSEIQEADRLSLTYDLFLSFKKIYGSEENSRAQSFPAFFKLGQTILNDFNEVDNYLIRASELFRNLADITEIDAGYDWMTEEQKKRLKEFWVNFAPDKKSSQKDKFLQLQSILPVLYQNFTEKLVQNRYAYSGLIYRKFAERLKEEDFLPEKYSQFIFIGFNALNKAEKSIFSSIKKYRKVRFFFDVDSYYLRDKKQEAGDFLRDNFKFLEINPQEYPAPENFTADKKLRLLSVPLQVGQAKAGAEILKNELKNEKPEDCALVLSDEHLLFPALYAVPPAIETINVTMGYPFKATGLFSLIEAYIRLQREAARKKRNAYYYKDVFALLKHPLTEESSPEEVERILQKIETMRLPYIVATELTQSDADILKLMFDKLPEENGQFVLTQRLMDILFLIFDKRKTQEGESLKSVHNEFVHKAFTHIKRLNDLTQSRNIELNIQLAGDLILQSLAGEQIPFSGNLQKGLQVMGVLETRNLDFKNVIIVGLNEGNFPKLSRPDSFIPENMRYAFGLPVIRQKDAVYAYLFYRLLQRAENIWMIYNNIISDKNSGELSRFVKQIQAEAGFDIEESRYKQKLSTGSRKEIEIVKSDFVFEKLERYLYEGDLLPEKRFSASALNTYINCPLKFYFSYIAGFENPPDLEADTVVTLPGILLHSSLEIIYRKFTESNKAARITDADLDEALRQVPEAVEKAFTDYFETETEISNSFLEGNHIIIKEVVKDYIKKVLNIDRRHTPFEILKPEEKLSAPLEFNFKKTKKRVEIFGIIDRTDRLTDCTRIIDYKSGRIDKQFSSFEDLFSSEKNKNNDAIVQVFLYSMLYKRNNPTAKIQPGIYDVRTMNQNNFSPHIKLKSAGKINPDIFSTLLPDFEANVRQKIEEIFNPDLPFQQTDNMDICIYCEFKKICLR